MRTCHVVTAFHSRDDSVLCCVAMTREDALAEIERLLTIDDWGLWAKPTRDQFVITETEFIESEGAWQGYLNLTIEHYGTSPLRLKLEKRGGLIFGYGLDVSLSG